ncbi:hypothetical protein [Campylobacter concisus]|uniref:hypothetical protein n=1 Tax=Campylobacter concisus TaxID=199 RepID=UPI00122C475E|nr:hypothetical protein [Campylobacter concisus]
MQAFRALYYAFCALLLGLSAALLVSLSVWLEMRVHNRYIVAGFFVAGLLYGLFQKRTAIFALVFSQSLLFLVTLWLGKQELLFYLIKESYLEILTLSQVKYLFLGVLTFLNIFFLFKFTATKGKI